MPGNNVRIPGQEMIFGGAAEFPLSIMILQGPAGSGKTLYGLQFLKDALSAGMRCLYINCSSGLSVEKFNSYFRNGKARAAPPYIAPFGENEDSSGLRTTNDSLLKNADGKTSISDLLVKCTDFISNLHANHESLPIFIVVDSVTDISARYSSDDVNRFVAKLYDFLKAKGNVMALLIRSANPLSSATDILGSLVDGVIQLRMEDSGDEVERKIRILSLKGVHNTPRWVEFQVQSDGALDFGRHTKVSQGEASCKLCDRPILGQASMDSGFTFHSNCLDTYRKLGEIYGSHSVYALQPGVVNANFFFIDIVGLSDPLLSVEKQIRKIEELNSLIGGCDAFSKVSGDRKIVLPTGDGMAIGFLVNPELPLQLSMQLHQKLRAFNSKQVADKTIGVRIGLSSGPVFVVRDINSNQNVWGPGIILARRVMDLGDNGHILLADNIAEALTNLKDEYRHIIRLVSDEIRIKHGQPLRLYSAHSPEFGNPAKPTRITEST